VISARQQCVYDGPLAKKSCCLSWSFCYIETWESKCDSSYSEGNEKSHIYFSSALLTDHYVYKKPSCRQDSRPYCLTAPSGSRDVIGHV